MADKERKLCGAKRKRGMGKCKANAMANGRCRMHGGASIPPGDPRQQGRQHNLKHGIYVKSFTEHEVEILAELKTGSVVHELNACRIQLRRILIEAKRVRDADEEERERLETGSLPEKYVGYEFESIEDGESEKGAFDKTVRKRPNFNTLIDRYMSRIGTLERIELELNGGDIDPEDKAARILRALNLMEGVTNGL